MQPYYKVVSIERKNKKVHRYSYLHYRLRSSCLSMDPELQVEYHIDKPAVPILKGTKLMVFGDKAAALRFAGTNEWSLQIWECTVTNPVPLYNIFDYVVCSGRPPYLSTIWELLLAKDSDKADVFDLRASINAEVLKKEQPNHYTRYVPAIDFTPNNTFACDSVTLVKQIFP